MSNEKYVQLRQKLVQEFRIAEDLIEKDKLTPEAAKVIKDEVERIEFDMQESLGFEKNKNKHRYGYRIPGCTCPILDNDDMFGCKNKYINESCIYHAGKEKE